MSKPNHQRQHEHHQQCSGPVVTAPDLVALDDEKREAAVAALVELLGEALHRGGSQRGGQSGDASGEQTT